MTQRQRDMLRKLMVITGEIGGQLDYTATCYQKLADRQQLHRHVSTVIYGVLMDHPDNDERADDLERAEKALQNIVDTAAIIYPDRNGELQRKYPLQ